MYNVCVTIKSTDDYDLVKRDREREGGDCKRERGASEPLNNIYGVEYNVSDFESGNSAL